MYYIYVNSIISALLENLAYIHSVNNLQDCKAGVHKIKDLVKIVTFASLTKSL